MNAHRSLADIVTHDDDLTLDEKLLRVARVVDETAKSTLDRGPPIIVIDNFPARVQRAPPALDVADGLLIGMVGTLAIVGLCAALWPEKTTAFVAGLAEGWMRPLA